MIDRIEALIAKTTPEPWTPMRHGVENYERENVPDGFPPLVVMDNNITPENAAFIAHARQLLPLMLEALKIADDLATAHIGGDFAEFIPLSDDLNVSLEKLEDYCAEHLPDREEKS